VAVAIGLILIGAVIVIAAVTTTLVMMCRDSVRPVRYRPGYDSRRPELPR